MPHRYLTTMTCVAVLAACQPAPDKASTEASVMAETTVAETTEQWLASWRKKEMSQLTAHPKAAVRTSDILTVFVDEKAVARFTDIDSATCEGFETCSLWRFDGMIDLHGPAGKARPYFKLLRNNGEIELAYLLTPAGELYEGPDSYLSSPDGRFLAVGSQENLITSGSLQVVDFSSPDHLLTGIFDAQCDIKVWSAPRSFDVICSRDDAMTYETAGRVEETSPGVWRFQETSVLKKPAGETLELRSETVSVSRKTPSASELNELDAHFISVGFLRLIN